MKRKGLSPKEVSVIKGIMKHYPKQTNQKILSWFSVSGRLINGGRISEIRTGHPRYARIGPCKKTDADKFIGGQLPIGQLMDPYLLPGMDADAPARKEKIFGFLEVEVGASMLRALTQESAFVEFKGTYEANSVGVYIKTLSAMLNSGHHGGICFGVTDGGIITGISKQMREEPFHRGVKAYFEPFYEVQIEEERVASKKVTCVKTVSSPRLPIICRKTKSGRPDARREEKTILEEGAIYYRYGSSTEKIRYAELRNLLDKQGSNG